VTTFRNRWAFTMSTALLVGTIASAPARADTQSPGPVRAALQSFSTDTIKAPRPQPAANAVRAQTAAPAGNSFFKTSKGAVALGLMIGGAAFTVWSINHDRKPVKSPVR
jgi:hypothetical protein